mmetsp:Transcript_62038/g.126066  ORF Transcript_62038/g.126066 Transcript_62038/m.126066 type:complete len:88 (+) Transcript_62038:58-321(+)
MKYICLCPRYPWYLWLNDQMAYTDWKGFGPTGQIAKSLLPQQGNESRRPVQRGQLEWILEERNSTRFAESAGGIGSHDLPSQALRQC